MFYLFINADEKLADAFDEGVERAAHVLLELQDDGGLLIDWPQEGSLENVVRDGDQLFILAVQGLDLSEDGLVLRVSTIAIDYERLLQSLHGL